MENIINLKVFENRKWENGGADFGVELENGVTILRVILPQTIDASSWEHFLEFCRPNGNKAIQGVQTVLFDAEEGLYYFDFTLSKGLINQSGTYNMQYVARKGDLIWKSEIRSFRIKAAIIGVESITPTKSILDIVDAKIDAALNPINNRLSAAESALITLDGRIATTESALITLDGWIAGMESALSSLGGRVAALEHDLGLPIEVETEEEMQALLVAANIGKIYKYVGLSTDNFENGELYAVREAEE